MTASTLRIPITNRFAGGDYTAELRIGSDNVIVNLLMDTGSSTFAVQQGSYNPASDSDLVSGELAQAITYGTGGWAGPVVTTKVTLGSGSHIVTLTRSQLAVIVDNEPGDFGKADGILGLAYSSLNTAVNLSTYLAQVGHPVQKTYPWPFAATTSPTAINRMAEIFERMRVEDVEPYFTELEQNGLVANRFAFYTLRSMPSADPGAGAVNDGWLIIGGGLEQTDLYTGDALSVAVVGDRYYNVTLQAVQVTGAAEQAVAPLPSEYRQMAGSNAIVDSGTNSLFLAEPVFTAVINSIVGVNSDFEPILKEVLSQGIVAADRLTLEDWPTINFRLLGADGGSVTLTCAPSTYWQTNAPTRGQAMFLLSNGGQTPQSILGLPLMNNYYTIFDRSAGPTGVVQFAAIK